MEEQRSWADLTYEALVEVLKRVGFEELYVAVPLVCKSWRTASLDKACWQRVDMDPCFSSRRESGSWWQRTFESKMDYTVKLIVDRSCGSLLELSTRHCSDSAISYLASRCPSIRHLSISSSSGVTETSICQIAKSCPRLEQLEISECQNVSSYALEQICLNCKSLTVLKKNRFVGDYDPTRKRLLPPEYSRMSSPAHADAEVNMIAKLLQDLKHLELRHSKISDQGLASLLEGCPNLEYLDLFGCSNLTRRALDEANEKRPNLKVYHKPTAASRTNMDIARYGHWQLYDERFQHGFFQF